MEVTYNGDTIIVNVCQFVELFLDLGVFPLWSGARRSAQVSVNKVTSIAWLFETTGLENDILDATRMKAGPVDTAWKHCGKGAGVIVVANLLRGSLSYEVGRKRRRRRRERGERGW